VLVGPLVHFRATLLAPHVFLRVQVETQIGGLKSIRDDRPPERIQHVVIDEASAQRCAQGDAAKDHRGGRLKMASQDDVRRIALSLPDVIQEDNNFRFAVMDRENGKCSFHTQSFVWGWSERIHPKKPRVARSDVMAFRVADLGQKEMLVSADSEKFFADAHYNGFAVVHARLPAIDIEELAELITDAWRCLAPSLLVSDFDERSDRQK